MQDFCYNCKYWIDGGEKEEVHRHDRLGSCHRYAPRPSLGDTEHEILKHLVILSWQAATDEEKETESADWEEAWTKSSVWPGTLGSGWCGEWASGPQRKWTDLPSDDDK